MCNMQFQSNALMLEVVVWNIRGKNSTSTLTFKMEKLRWWSSVQSGSGVWWNGDSGKNGDHLLWKGLWVCIKCENVNSAKCSAVLSRIYKYWVWVYCSPNVGSVKVPLLLPHPHPPIFPPLSTVGLWCPRWEVVEFWSWTYNVPFYLFVQFGGIIKIYFTLKGCLTLQSF